MPTVTAKCSLCTRYILTAISKRAEATKFDLYLFLVELYKPVSHLLV